MPSKKNELSLLDNVQMPDAKGWRIDWEQIRALHAEGLRILWNESEVYRDLFGNMNRPAVDYFAVDEKESNRLSELFAKVKANPPVQGGKK